MNIEVSSGSLGGGRGQIDQEKNTDTLLKHRVGTEQTSKTIKLHHNELKRSTYDEKVLCQITKQPKMAWL